MVDRKSRTRGWLIFAGIVVMLLSLGMMKFWVRVLFSKMGFPLLLVGGAIVLLGLLGKRKRGDKR